MVAHVTTPTAAELDRLPGWATLVRAPNPGPMTLDGTNTWVLRAPGSQESVVVDPGPDDEGHLAAVAAHAPVRAILITHGHPDHVEGAARLAGMLGGVPVGTGPPVGTGLTIRAIRTPGHTADSVSFHVSVGAEQAVLTGDTVLGRGTTVVAWPDGDLGDYLASLRALTAFDQIPVLPGHGPPLADCAAAASFYLRHRLARLDQVRAAMTTGAHDAEAVVTTVYADVDRALWPAALLSVRAQLDYLRRESQPTPAELDEP
jgi:glyoxylase-like metal-dependent hydrolase (beta-lactamase superfamily II)